LIADPGKRFINENLSPQIGSIMIAKLTGMKASAFADKRLFEPLAMHDVRWDGVQIVPPEWVRDSTARHIIEVPDLCPVVATTESRCGGSGTEHLLPMSRQILPSIIR
jgi:hypothetical protein